MSTFAPSHSISPLPRKSMSSTPHFFFLYLKTFSLPLSPLLPILWVSTINANHWNDRKIDSFFFLTEKEFYRRLVVLDSLQFHGFYSPWSYLGQKTGMGNFSILQGIFLTLHILQHSTWELSFLFHLKYPFGKRRDSVGTFRMSSAKPSPFGKSGQNVPGRHFCCKCDISARREIRSSFCSTNKFTEEAKRESWKMNNTKDQKAFLIGQS